MLDLYLSTSQKQTLSMTPQLRQAIALLALPNQAVMSEIAFELEHNPYLKAIEPQQVLENERCVLSQQGDIQKHACLLSPAQSRQAQKDFHEKERSHLQTQQQSAHNSDQQASDLSHLISAKPSLREYLDQHIALSFSNKKQKRLAQLLSHELSAAGYIECDLSQFAQKAKVSDTELEAVLLTLQQIEPAGLFARNLAECLALQLQEKGLLSQMMQTLLEHLDWIAQGKFTALERALNVDSAGLSQALQLLRSLNPKPGLAFDHNAVMSIDPDVIVTLNKENALVFQLNTRTLPLVVFIDQPKMTLADASFKGRIKVDQSYWEGQKSKARWLSRALSQRSATLLNISAYIVNAQRDFFINGQETLKPLTLKSVAQHLELHESSVSRVIADKYMQTPWGTFALKRFFSNALNEQQQHCSANAVQAIIKRMINAEDSLAPLSDQDLSNQLSADGIHLARRTVAKYREALGIPSANLRKRSARIACLAD